MRLKFPFENTSLKVTEILSEPSQSKVTLNVFITARTPYKTFETQKPAIQPLLFLN